MKLAQALNLRKKIKTDMSRTQNLIQAIAVQVAGDVKQDDEPNALVQSLLDQMKEYEKISNSIDNANQKHSLANGLLLTQALIRRDSIARCKKEMEPLLNIQRGSSYGREEGQRIMVLDKSKLKRIVDDLSRQWRELDDLIQEANWRIDVHI